MKTCSTCKQEKSKSEFNKKTSTKDGFEHYCKDCHRARNKRHYEANKQSYIDTSNRWSDEKRRWWMEYKQTLSCSICGESRYWCLDMHHVDPSTKEYCVSHMVSANRSKSHILAEVAKCVVLCKNCHANAHHVLNNDPQALR